MANASVEKLKALGLRHGEKAAMGVTVAVCLLCLVAAVSKPTIDLSADQVKKAAQSAESNINRKQDEAQIVKALEEAGIKDAGFETIVDDQAKTKLDVVAFKPARPWVTQEPGAGLIRDMPELIAPTELAVYPGRGGVLVYELDANGERIPAPPKSEDPDTLKRRRKKRRGGSMMASSSGSGSGSGMAGMMGTPAKKSARQEEEEKKRQAAEEKKKARALVGLEEAKAKDAAEKTEEETTEGPMKEITKGMRWVVITGVIDNKKLRDNYLAALKNPAIAYPNYKYLEVQRQARQPDGSWADWEDVDADRNNEVLNNLPEEEEELAPATVRIDTLVDPLPFLKAGSWEGVHIARLVPKEKRETPKPPANQMMGSGMMPGMMPGMSSGGSDSAMMPGAMPPGMMGGSGSSMMMPGSGMEGGMMPGALGAGTADTADFPKSEEDTIMLRSLDFTVDPDQSYRYRIRIVVYNPNKDREDVSPGVDNKSENLYGPWSEATDEVTMPADVEAYAMDKLPNSARIGDKVRFQVMRWTPDDGVTVSRDFTAGPGEVIGTPVSTPIPSSEGAGAKPKVVDFNTHRVVLDVVGGELSVPSIGAQGGARFDAPVITLLVRPDGSVAVRDQADDANDQVRKEMYENYRRELKDSDKKRESSMGVGSSMMMPGMMSR